MFGAAICVVYIDIFQNIALKSSIAKGTNPPTKNIQISGSRIVLRSERWKNTKYLGTVNNLSDAPDNWQGVANARGTQ